MKRLLFVFGIIAVLGVVGFYVYLEFSVAEITYVSDTERLSTKGNEIAIYRLYTSGIDVETFMEKIEQSQVATEFTEDEIIAAAIASGKPEFYPAFFMSVFVPSNIEYNFSFEGAVRQAFAESQKDVNYMFKDVNLEVISEGFEIENVDCEFNNKNLETLTVPIISEDKTAMMINLDNVSKYRFSLKGERGMLTFQYTYDIVSNSLLPNVALSKQLLIVYADISVSESGELQVSYITEPYSSLEEYAEG